MSIYIKILINLVLLAIFFEGAHLFNESGLSAGYKITKEE